MISFSVFVVIVRIGIHVTNAIKAQSHLLVLYGLYLLSYWRSILNYSVYWKWGWFESLHNLYGAL